MCFYRSVKEKYMWQYSLNIRMLDWKGLLPLTQSKCRRENPSSCSCTGQSSLGSFCARGGPAFPAACPKTIPAVAGLGHWEREERSAVTRAGAVSSSVLLLCSWAAWPLTSSGSSAWSVSDAAQSTIWPPDFSLLVSLTFIFSVGKKGAHNCQKKTVSKNYLYIEGK